MRLIILILMICVSGFACNSSQKQFTVGKKYFYQQQYDEALAGLNRVIEKDSSNAQAWYYRGMIFYDRKNLRKAETNFITALELGIPDSLSCNAYRILSDLNNEFRNPGLAISYLEKHLGCKPGNHELLLEIAKMCSTTSDYPKAIRYISNSMKDLPENEKLIDALLFRGSMYQRLHKYDSAAADFSSAIQLNEENPRPYIQRAFMLEKLDDYCAAIEDYDHAIELKDDDESFYLLRGMARLRTADTTGALEDLNTAIATKIDFAQAYYFRGEIYFNLNDPDKACDNWRKAAVLGMYNAVEEKLLYLCK